MHAYGIPNALDKLHQANISFLRAYDERPHQQAGMKMYVGAVEVELQ